LGKAYTYLRMRKITVQKEGASTKKIVVDQADFNKMLTDQNIQCLKDPDGYEIRAFEALVDGGTYGAGPQSEAKTGPQRYFPSRIYSARNV